MSDRAKSGGCLLVIIVVILALGLPEVIKEGRKEKAAKAAQIVADEEYERNPSTLCARALIKDFEGTGLVSGPSTVTQNDDGSAHVLSPLMSGFEELGTGECVVRGMEVTIIRNYDYRP